MSSEVQLPNDPTGLALFRDGHRTRLKWHRLRRSMSDPLFDAATMQAGFVLGASMELDLRVRADGGFVVLHDTTLDRETTGHGAIAATTRAGLQALSLDDSALANPGPPRALLLSEELAPMLKSAHPEALLQFDMKDDFGAIGPAGVAHLAEYFSDSAASIIVSGASLELIVQLRDKAPNLLRGIDPTRKLAALHRDSGLGAVEAELLADLRGPTDPDTVYLQWNLILQAQQEGLDLIALCQAEGRKVDAWTFTLKSPATGFDEAEWHAFSALMALNPDQITTDEAPATERAYRARL